MRRAKERDQKAKVPKARAVRVVGVEARVEVEVGVGVGKAAAGLFAVERPVSRVQQVRCCVPWKDYG